MQLQQRGALPLARARPFKSRSCRSRRRSLSPSPSRSSSVSFDVSSQSALAGCSFVLEKIAVISTVLLPSASRHPEGERGERAASTAAMESEPPTRRAVPRPSSFPPSLIQFNLADAMVVVATNATPAPPPPKPPLRASVNFSRASERAGDDGAELSSGVSLRRRQRHAGSDNGFQKCFQIRYLMILMGTVLDH